MRLPEEATQIGEWSARCLSHLQDVVALTEAAAGFAMSNAILRARLADLEDGNEVIDAALDFGKVLGRASAYGGAGAQGGEDELVRTERDEWKREADRLMLELGEAMTQLNDWKKQFELSDTNCGVLAAKLDEREKRLAAVEAEWEAQAGRIMDLEQQLASRPDECPECFEPLVPAPPVAQVAEAAPEPLVFGLKKACKICKKKFVAKPANRKYCDDCKSPTKTPPKGDPT